MMYLARALSLTLVSLTIGLLAMPADAQIYSWRDANGVLVLSDRPQAGAATVAVAGSHRVRTTRPVTVPERSRGLDRIIERHAATHRIRPDLVRAVIQIESGFDPNARSPKGAMGLMQLMPATAEELGVVNAYDPEQNIRGGVAYLRQLLERYDGDEELALAAYNAGPGAVERHGNQVPPYRETQDYVEKIRTTTGLATAVPRGAGDTIYKWFELVDGRRVPVYSNVRSPSDDEATVVTRPR